MMRPISLTMNAFGAYVEKTTIAFDALKDQRLFLISGATGAGKTTIFDAMIFALYGEASGSQRQPKTMRSQLAARENLTYVDFQFEVNGDLYQIHREPKQPNPDPKAKNEREQKVEFQTPQGTISRITEAKSKSEELLGLTARQFRQVVMLPQGEFQRMITADTKERRETFRQIFNTVSYRQLELALKDQARAATQAAASAREAIQNEQAAISAALPTADQEAFVTALNQENFAVALAMGQTTHTRWQAEQNQRQQAITAAEVERQQVEQALQLLEEAAALQAEGDELSQQAEQMAALNAAITQHDQARPLYQIYEQQQAKRKQLDQKHAQLVETEQQLAAITTEQEQLATDQKQWAEAIQALPQQREQLQQAQQSLAAWEDYTARTALLNQEQADYARERQETDQRAEESDACQAKLLTLKQQLEQLEQAIKGEDYFEWLISDWEHKNAQLAQDQSQWLNYQATVKNYQELEVVMQKLEHQEADARQQQVQLEQQWQEGWRQQLSDQLVAGEPCPVCGSRNHPAPATGQAVTVSEVQVQAGRHQVEDIARQVATKHEQWEQVKQKLQQFAPQVTSDWETQLQEQSQWLSQQHTAIENQKRHNQELTLQHQALKKDYEQQQQVVTQLSADVSQRMGALQVKADYLTHEAQSLAEQKKQLTGNSQEEQQTLTKALADTITMSEQAQERLTAQATRLTNEQTNVASRYEERQRSYKDYQMEAAHLQAAVKREEAALGVTVEKILPLFTSTSDWEADRRRLSAYQSKQQMHQIKQQQNERARHQAQVSGSWEQYHTKRQLLATEVEKQNQAFQEKQKELTLLADRLARLKKAITDYQAHHQSSAALREMHAIASGQVNTAPPISFETYVLQQYFDQVIVRANEQLSHMTGGQYHFVRDEESTAQRANKELGLDLSVFDAFTGQIRSVNTLSGGEMFQASLAFALGLSTIIQEQAGAIDLGLLFIDEGFGSLDAESLALAMETLEELESQGDRLIGIISHVEELKTQLPVHLEVVKDESGSHAHFSGLI